MGIDPAKLFHAAETYMQEKLGFDEVSVVDPTRMVEGYIIGVGLRQGNPDTVRITRDDLESFLKEKLASQQLGEAEK